MAWGAWHECRHMAAHLGTADEKSSIMEDRPDTAVLRQVDRVTYEADQTLDEDVSSHSTKHLHRDVGHHGAKDHAMGSMRIEHAAYGTPPPSVGVVHKDYFKPRISELRHEA